MRRSALLFVMTAALGTPGCGTDAGPGGPPPGTSPPAGRPGTPVPAELVGAWEHGPIDLARWEDQPGFYAGRNAAATREAMVIGRDGGAKFYRYEFASGLYEELIDCEGVVTFDGDGTFTFAPARGRKRYFDTRHPANNKDRPLTPAELTGPKLAGQRRYAYAASSDPVALRITVPGSAPYNWYKKP